MLTRRQFLACTAALSAIPLVSAKAMLRPLPDALSSLAGLPVVRGKPLADTDVTDRPVLMTFWASWCPPCRDEFRHFNEIQAIYRDRGLLVLGINAFEDFGGLSSEAKRNRFLKQTQPTFQLVEATAGTLKNFGGISRIPSVLLFDAAGKVVFQFVHQPDASKMHVTFDELKPVLDALLND